MAQSSSPVLIAGGGIGGLSAAIALAAKGIPSHVLERKPEFSEAGAGIQLGPNATRLLISLGVDKELAALVATPDALTVHDGTNGRLLTRLPLGSWIAARHGGPYWTVHRQDLHAALLNAARGLACIEISNGCEVQSFEDGAGGISAKVSDGGSKAGMALIAADGLWSRLRSQIAPGPTASPAGKCAYRSVISRNALPRDLADNGVHIWLSPGAHVVHYPVRAGSEIAIVAVLDDPTPGDSWSLPAPQNWVSERAARYPAMLRDLLAAAGEWRMWSLQKIDRLPNWTKGRAALLGDAAHPIFPFLAQGGVLAIEDACSLADCLAAAGDVPQRLARYAALRRPRTARVVDASARNGTIYHLDGALAVARNAVMRTASPARLMASYDWLYGYRI